MDVESVENQMQSLEWIIKRVLKEKGFSKNHNDYEDYAQELRITLYNELKHIVISDMKIVNLIGYTQQLLRWKLKKLLRSASRNRSYPTQENFMLEQPFFDDGYYEAEIALNLPKGLSPRERLLFHYLYLGYSVPQIAVIMKLNIRTLRRWRDRLRTRFNR